MGFLVPEHSPIVMVFKREGMIGYSREWVPLDKVPLEDKTVLGLFGSNECYEKWLHGYRHLRHLVHARN